MLLTARGAVHRQLVDQTQHAAQGINVGLHNTDDSETLASAVAATDGWSKGAETRDAMAALLDVPAQILS